MTPLVPGNAVAAIITAGGGYLLQLRDLRHGVFFPGCWGCFGGGVDEGESDLDALRRELREELAFEPPPDAVTFFTRFDFDLRFAGLKPIYRSFYVIDVPEDELGRLRLGEGAEMKLQPADAILQGSLPLTPYDSFALWLHLNGPRLTSPT